MRPRITEPPIIASIIAAITAILVAIINKLPLSQAVILVVVFALIGFSIIFFIIQIYKNSSSSTNDISNLEALVDKVKSLWINNESLPTDNNFINLKFEDRSQGNQRRILEGESITDIFNQVVIREFGKEKSARTLLILGEMGSGKTLTLRQILKDLLLANQELENNIPVPVVFNLSSWKNIGQGESSIVKWLVEELAKSSLYGISEAVGKKWVENEKLVLLIDGLNELKTELRQDCVKSLNKFIEKYSKTDIVVCSRIEEYNELNELSVTLKFKKKIYIQPLDNQQITNYLIKTNSQLAAEVNNLLERLYSENFKLAKTPLLLSLIRSTIENKLPINKKLIEIIVPSLSRKNINLQEISKDLFNNYIQQMFNIHQLNIKYQESDVRRWLIWLAKKLRNNSQPYFYIEDMQPGWLAEEKAEEKAKKQAEEQKKIYQKLSIFGVGILSGVPLGGIIGAIIDCWISAFSLNTKGNIVWLVGLGLIVGLIIGPFVSYSQKKHEKDIKAHKQVKFSFKEAQKNLKYSLIIGIKLGLAILFFCLIFMSLIYKSWQIGFIAGLTAGGFFGLVVTISSAIGDSLTDEPVEKTVKPNQGIWNSCYQAVIIFIISSFTFIIIYALFIFTVNKTNIFMLSIGLCFAIITGIVTVMAHSSGTSISQHFILRIVLEKYNFIPKDYAGFLNEATNLGFLQKVGGGYSFRHELLRDEFAQLKLDESQQGDKTIWKVLVSYLKG
ncbi:NACHT domain-containing protein [Nostoc favosum]|uniref:NACHT domain-containing protein n=1 Tax=Nostoc favosum CHAB5714 TaxID=2780399 RepID=A0ABS8I9K7_9NOSO|nr:NACHT domain-containing protein [Nostoc favosum]MCC5600780.1 NACHT domain-containing protein [Nostoc favosum CHAB5714]